MDKEQVEILFKTIEQEAAHGAESRLDSLAQTVGYMRGMIKDNLLYGVPLEKAAERILNKETANA